MMRQNEIWKSQLTSGLYKGCHDIVVFNELLRLHKVCNVAKLDPNDILRKLSNLFSVIFFNLKPLSN